MVISYENRVNNYLTFKHTSIILISIEVAYNYLCFSLESLLLTYLTPRVSRIC